MVTGLLYFFEIDAGQRLLPVPGTFELLSGVEAWQQVGHLAAPPLDKSSLHFSKRKGTSL
jgi:hypothetical protein